MTTKKDATIKEVEEIVSVLTEEQRLLLKDTIRHGAWGDADSTFLSEDGVCETDFMFGYCTNDAKKGGAFHGQGRVGHVQGDIPETMPG